MAVMYPRTLLEDDLKSRAEGKVFDALEKRLGDGWEVFHSVGWVSRDKEKGSDDGEIDFVIAHPERGVLCLEVKGGGIECKHGEWFGIHDLLETFPVRVISGIEGIEKPDERIYRLALERGSVHAAESVYVGDNPEFDVDPPELAAVGR